jgi:hepatocyte growth factor-regulated tyrosine kinase substrate
MVLSKSEFRELVQNATSPLIPSSHEDISAFCEISDAIRAKCVAPQFAIQELKQRLTHTNPNVQIVALSVCETTP